MLTFYALAPFLVDSNEPHKFHHLHTRNAHYNCANSYGLISEVESYIPLHGNFKYMSTFFCLHKEGRHLFAACLNFQ